MRPALLLILRIALAIPGGYALTAGTVALATALLAALMPRAEAFVLSAMLGFLLYLAILIWAFAEPRLLRLAVVIPPGAWGCFALAEHVGA